MGLVLNYSGLVWRDDLGHRIPSISSDTHKGEELITTILLFILSADRNTETKQCWHTGMILMEHTHKISIP